MHLHTNTDKYAQTYTHINTQRNRYIQAQAYTQRHALTSTHTEHRHYKASLGTYHFYRDPLLPPFASEQYQETFAKGLKPFVTQWSLVTLFLLVPRSHPVTAPCRRALGSTSTGSASAPISPPHPLSLETSSFIS